MRKIVTLRQALSDPGFLAHALPGDSWSSWRILLIGAIGEELTEAEREVWRSLTGRDAEPGCMVEIFEAIVGRRGGKSKAMAVLCVYLATLCDWSEELSFERGLALIVAPSERQAANILRYALGIIEASPLLADLVENKTLECITLARGVDIEVQCANWRRVRGSTCVGICIDEGAFLYTADDSANSDRELLIALKPSLATTGGMLMLTSSPNAMEGVVYDIHKRHHGPQGDPRILVVQSDTKTLNPKIRDEVISRAYEDDPTSAESEFGGAFRQLSTAYLPRSVVEGAVDKQATGRYVLPGIQYFGHCDPAGGTGRDSMTLAIGHKVLDGLGREIATVDALAEVQPPFDTDEIVERFASILKLWGINEITVDNYAAGWVVSAFMRHGITVMHNAISTSDIYTNVIPQFMSKRVRLLNHQRSVDQLCGLRRKVGQAGREIVTHPAQGHDDLAAAICALLWRLSPGSSKSSGDHWCEYLRRELEEPGRRGTDYDDVRAASGPPPDFGFCFDTQPPELPESVKLVVPSPIAETGAVQLNRLYICRKVGDVVTVELPRSTATYLLRNSVWRALNETIAREILDEKDEAA
jgi:hypothetical protein